MPYGIFQRGYLSPAEIIGGEESWKMVTVKIVSLSTGQRMQQIKYYRASSSMRKNPPVVNVWHSVL